MQWCANDEKTEQYCTETFGDMNSLLDSLAAITDSPCSVYFTDDAEIRELNAGYRGKDEVTDILSFQMPGEGLLGEIVIDPFELTKRAKEQGDDLREHFAYLFFHSYLHLLGFDHTTEEEYRNMEEKTEDLLGRWLAL